MRPERTEAATGVAQSEVVGILVVLGVTFVSISAILVMGMPTVDQAQDLAQIERVQVEFLSFDQELRETVHTPGQSGASVNLDEGGISVDSGSSIWVNVTHDPSYGGASPATTGRVELGGLRYETGDSGVSYQMGGVWKTYGDDGFSMETPPDITYEDRSLKMDMTNFTEEVHVEGTGRREFTIRSEGTERIEEPAGSLANGTLSITVATDYDDSWTEYFNRTFGEDAVDGSGDGFANVSLRTGPPLYGVEYLAGRYEVDNIAGVLPDDEHTHIYDSRIGNESLYNDTLDLGNSGVLGNVLGGSSIDLPEVPDACIRSGTGENLPGPPEDVTAGEYEDVDVPSTVEFDTSAGDISAYLDDSHVQLGPNLEFDTSGGTVEIHLQDGTDLRIRQSISVEGHNPVYIYVENGDVDIGSSVDVHLEDGNTELLQIYASGADNVDVHGEFNGTIYSPDEGIEIEERFRGAAIGEDVEPDEGGLYYHDTALRRADVPDCIEAPLSSFEAVERKVSIR